MRKCHSSSDIRYTAYYVYLFFYGEGKRRIGLISGAADAGAGSNERFIRRACASVGFIFGGGVVSGFSFFKSGVFV